MRKIFFAVVILIAPVTPSVQDGADGQFWRISSAVAQPAADVSPKEAFVAARELGTAEAWNTFLENYPSGFYTDLARAYVKKLNGGASTPAAASDTSITPREPAAAGAPQPPPSADARANDAAAANSAPAELNKSAMPQDSSRDKTASTADLDGMQLLPADSPWHRDISGDPVDPRSQQILKRVGLATPLHPDFGGEWEGAEIGIPFVVVGKDQPRVPVQFQYADESDKGPYAIPPNAPIEGGPKSDGDRHVIVFDRESLLLYELFNAFPLGNAGWKADSGAIWELKKNQVRPAGWTSADAAGLPIFPGLVRHDEVVGKKVIEHALRFTLRKSRRAYVPPASHWASNAHDEDLPPMGMRVRLKADYDVSGFGPEATVILLALKKYGMFLADNGGNFFISGTHDRRWDADAIGQLKRVTAIDLEVIEMKGMVSAKR